VLKLLTIVRDILMSLLIDNVLITGDKE